MHRGKPWLTAFPGPVATLVRPHAAYIAAANLHRFPDPLARSLQRDPDAGAGAHFDGSSPNQNDPSTTRSGSRATAIPPRATTTQSGSALRGIELLDLASKMLLADAPLKFERRGNLALILTEVSGQQGESLDLLRPCEFAVHFVDNPLDDAP